LKTHQKEGGLKHFSVAAEVVNVSKGGMSIECNQKLERGRVYSLRLLWGDNVFDAKCEAVWTLDGGNGRGYRSGVKFVQMNQYNISDFVASLQGHMADVRRFHHRKKIDNTKALLSYP
jgi:hypothetical protein